MSRPDWGALQQEYIAEYTRSGISPVAWCEARGLNYATARRYIKKTPKNAQTEMCKTAQKSAQKKSAQTAQKRNEKSQEKKPVFDAGLNEGDAEEFSFCPDEFGISDQQAKFAMLVAQGKKPTEAYRLAGYEGQGATANSNASRMLRNARVFRAISYFRNQYQKRYTADLDLLVSQLMAIVLADPNQLAQFRRVNCRYCWGENHLYQWRDIAEFDKAAAQASRDGKAYLRGQFTNLTSGTVYHQFDRKLNNCEEVEQPGEPIYIGMDFNVGKMAGIVHVLRLGLPCAVTEIINAYDTPDSGPSSPHLPLVQEMTSQPLLTEGRRQPGFSVAPVAWEYPEQISFRWSDAQIP